jgi:hypothetical protein
VDSGEDVYVGTKCRADFGDIRFTKSDGATLLDYWLESYDGGVAIFWVEVDSIPASPDTATIYIYYGKSDATTTSNGDNTFLFFDDFLGTSLDTNKWYVGTDTNGSYTVSGGELKLDACMVKSKTFTLANGAIRYKARATSGYEITSFVRCDEAPPWVEYDGSNGYGAHSSSYSSWEHTLYYVYNNISSTKLANTVNAISGSTNYIYEFRFTGSSLVFKRFSTANVEQASVSATHTAYTNGRIALRTDGTGNGDRVAYFDWVCARKYVSPEPSHGSWGSEEGIVIIERFQEEGVDFRETKFGATWA